uniref:Septin-type G domain-containing protein n=1 Tax=Romanomermis culicivorax TaxID=13658 RepID=A0A915IGG9_ROMCU
MSHVNLKWSSSKREQFFNNGGGNTPPVAAKPTPAALHSMNLSDKTANGFSNGDTHRSISPIVNASCNYATNGLMNGKENGASKVHQGHPVIINEVHGFVGFSNIPNQVFRKAIKRGFDFSLMVVGQSGLGKSTFVNTLFLTDICTPGKNTRLSTMTKTTRIEETVVKLVEKGVTLTLTLVDTPGFGDAVDNSNCWDTVIQYIDRKNMDFFNEETRVNRKDTIIDHRVHCCLYFIAPTGHGLKPLDIEFMKRLHDRVNIIPIIAKADTLTTEEMTFFKQKINKEIEEHKIKIYDFPDCDAGVGETKEQKRFRLDAKQRNYEKIIEEERRKVASLKESLDQDRQMFKQQYPEFHKYESSDSL